MNDLEGAPQSLHPLPETEEDGDARGVHEGDAAAVHHQGVGEDLVQLPVQVLQQAPDPVVVDLSGQSHGEVSVLCGVGHGHR